jgi:RNA polymerase sigma-70 factor (ECF subfamily)
MDDAAVREFVSRDYARVVNAVAFVAGSVEVAEDLVQEALARAWARSSRGETIESLPNWVAAVALNLSRSRWRRVLVERRHATRLMDATAAAGPDPDRVDVMRALASLPRRQREVAVLRYLLGMSTREVAAALHVGEGTVKNSLAKARQALAARLRVDDAEVVNDVPDR